MKKMYKYILIITLMMFGFVGEVRASDKDINKCVENGNCKLECTYKEKGKENYAYIYKINIDSWNYYGISFGASFSWKGNNKVYKLNNTNCINEKGEEDTCDIFNASAFIDEDLIKSYSEFSCPKYVYKNTRGQKEICFDNGDYCDSKFTRLELENDVIEEEKEEIKDTKLNAIKAKEKVQEYFNKSNDKSEIIELCVFNDNSVAEGNANQKFIVTLKDKFRYFSYQNIDGVESFKEFVEKNDKIDSLTSEKYLIEIKYKDYGESCLAISNVYGYTKTDSQCTDLGICKTTTFFGIADKKPIGNKYSVTEYSSDGNPFDSLENKNDDKLEEYTKCEDLLGDNLRKEINSYLLYIKVAIPIIIIVMGSLDFGKAFISSDEDSMKKAQKKFIMRLIIGMVIFFLPALVNILLNIANQVWGFSKGTCGITF